MIKWVTEHRIPFLILTLLLFVQSLSVDLNSPYKKPIAGDAQAYYAYLPAIFIYQDLDFQFVPEMQAKYYVPANSKSFLKIVDGEVVNKTFPGVTVLYLPFFLLAHAGSLMLGLPADGYAYLYQLFYLIGFWLYFLLGIIFFRKVLQEFNFHPRVIDFSLVIIALGTNIFFYTVYDQSVTHIYNFFLVNWAVYLLLKLKKNFQLSRLELLLSILALIGITRPTNILVLGTLLFFVPDYKDLKPILGAIFRIKNIFKVFLLPLFILSIPFILWKLQTNSWIVYSYGEEGFNFGAPELYNFLFSYTKGWFVYTPVMLFILVAGFVLLAKTHRPRFIVGLIFFGLAIYIFSSWWCWYYGAGMSQRVMIDFYIIPGYMLALVLQRFLVDSTHETSHSESIKSLAKPNKVRLTFAVTLGLSFLLLNIAQAYQISRGILPYGSPTKEQYWNNFLVFQKKAEVIPPAHWQFLKEEFVSMNPADSLIIKGSPVKKSGEWMLRVSETEEYSAVLRIPEYSYEKGSKLIISFDARSDNTLEQTRLVMVFEDGSQHVFFLGDYISSEWQKMQFLIEFEKDLISPVDLYLWNAGSRESAEVKGLSWSLYFTDTYY